MARRTKSLDDGCVEDYAQPYFEVVDADPGLDEMRRAVCDKGFRPTVPDRWQETEVNVNFDSGWQQISWLNKSFTI